MLRHLLAVCALALSSQVAAFSATMPTSTGGLFLFDFDGVVCDSCDECTISAFRTCRQLDALPKSFRSVKEPPEWLFSKMREIRPAIETGWQIPVLLSVFLTQQEEGSLMNASEIIENYERLIDEWLAKYDKNADAMIQQFGDVRDAWIKEDLDSWLEINKFYPNVPRSLSNCRGKSILVTTKQQRFATALCRHAGISSDALPDKDIFGLGMYKNKVDVICEQRAAGAYAAEDTYFFEDRWPTLVKCLKDDRLDGVHFHLASWGYVAEKELKLAQDEPRVEVITLDDFARIVSVPDSDSK